MAKVCPVCGKEFEGSKSKAYCSEECRKNKNKTKEAYVECEACIVPGNDNTTEVNLLEWDWL